MPISKSIADWVDERLGIRAIGEALFERKIPEGTGLVSWIYTLGSVVMFLFILQAVTGMFLAMNYAPTPETRTTQCALSLSRLRLAHSYAGCITGAQARW